MKSHLRILTPRMSVTGLRYWLYVREEVKENLMFSVVTSGIVFSLVERGVGRRKHLYYEMICLACVELKPTWTGHSLTYTQQQSEVWAASFPEPRAGRVDWDAAAEAGWAHVSFRPLCWSHPQGREGDWVRKPLAAIYTHGTHSRTRR